MSKEDINAKYSDGKGMKKTKQNNMLLNRYMTSSVLRGLLNFSTIMINVNL